MTRVARREQNDAAIRDAARAVFLERGFHAATMDQVADAAGLTKGALYARHDSKADLFLALFDEHVDQRITEVQKLTAASSDPESASRAVADQWLARAALQRDWTLLTVEFRVFAARNKDVLRRYRAAHRRLRAGIVDAFVELYGRASLPVPENPNLTIGLSLAAGTGVALEHIADPQDGMAEALSNLYALTARVGADHLDSL